MASSTRNQAHWDLVSDAYQMEHGSVLAQTAMAWGVWRIPESDVRVLGDVAGRDVLELGCGAAQWTLALIRAGVRAVGVDLSARQLLHARQTSSNVPVVQGNAENLPFQNQSFDVVFCDHGTTTFARPDHTVAEASRVLKPNGLLAFCMSTPIRDACWDSESDAVSTQLTRDYFSLSTLEDGDSVCYQLPYGVWIRLFRQHLLVVEDLIELRPPDGSATTYEGFVPIVWAQKWPAEHIWKLRKGA
jgi:SAM-dependent methyltransferase